MLIWTLSICYAIYRMESTDEFIQQLRQTVREKIGPNATPREIEFVNEIPKTATLKIKRSELKDKG
jgi:acyl-coenzyme A synthetase/AMP-(fatty) acid ligase